MLKYMVIILAFMYGIVISVEGQTDSLSYDENISKLLESSQKFSFDFYKYTTDLVDNGSNTSTANIIVAPLSAWILLSLISEGAGAQTLDEILHALNIERQEQIKNYYKAFIDPMSHSDNYVSVSSAQFIFNDENRPVSKDFETNLDHFYNPNILQATNFADQLGAYQHINKLISEATKGQIQQAIQTSDLQEARMVMISALFFQGMWTIPFNRSFTTKMPFHNENDEQIGTADMMFQRGVFVFIAFKELDAQILELPYGNTRRLSMLLVMPRKGVFLRDVVGRLTDFNINIIFDELNQNTTHFEDDEIEVLLPKFEFTSDFNLIPILKKLGISKAFDTTAADFSKISEINSVYISSFIQQTKVIVNEEGTTAAAVTTGVFANKATPQRFLANRPFMFLIVDKLQKTILFMGQVKDPNSVRT